MSSVTPAQPHLVAGKRIDDLYSIGRIESQSRKDHDTPPATGIRDSLRQGQTYGVKNHTTWDGLVLYEIRKASRAGWGKKTYIHIYMVVNEMCRIRASNCGISFFALGVSLSANSLSSSLKASRFLTSSFSSLAVVMSEKLIF